MAGLVDSITVAEVSGELPEQRWVRLARPQYWPGAVQDTGKAGSMTGHCALSTCAMCPSVGCGFALAGDARRGPGIGRGGGWAVNPSLASRLDSISRSTPDAVASTIAVRTGQPV